MRHLLTKILFALALPLCCVCVSSCGTDDPEPVEKPVPAPEPEEPVIPAEPAACDNKVVAHRGGAKELGETVPDNSLASLDYAKSLGCYASECDIYITADKRVVVAHADSDGKINGYYPFDATLDELRQTPLSNGEQIPTLEEYLDHAMTDGSCTRLWLDIKNVTKPETLPDHPV